MSAKGENLRASPKLSFGGRYTIADRGIRFLSVEIDYACLV